MRLFKVVLSAFLSFLFLYGHSQNKENADKEQKECSTLDKKKLGTEFEAIDKLKDYTFNFEQKFQTINVQGVQEATYFACENGLELMTVKTHRHEYLYENVDRMLWENFKNASSVNRYFYRNIRNNPRFTYP